MGSTVYIKASAILRQSLYSLFLSLQYKNNWASTPACIWQTLKVLKMALIPILRPSFLILFLISSKHDQIFLLLAYLLGCFLFFNVLIKNMRYLRTTGYGMGWNQINEVQLFIFLDYNYDFFATKHLVKKVTPITPRRK